MFILISVSGWISVFHLAKKGSWRFLTLVSFTWKGTYLVRFTSWCSDKHCHHCNHSQYCIAFLDYYMANATLYTLVVWLCLLLESLFIPTLLLGQMIVSRLHNGEQASAPPHPPYPCLPHSVSSLFCVGIARFHTGLFQFPITVTTRKSFRAIGPFCLNSSLF